MPVVVVVYDCKNAGERAELDDETRFDSGLSNPNNRDRVAAGSSTGKVSWTEKCSQRRHMLTGYSATFFDTNKSLDNSHYHLHFLVFSFGHMLRCGIQYLLKDLFENVLVGHMKHDDRKRVRDNFRR